MQTAAVAPDAYTFFAPVADAGDPGCLDVGGFGSDIPVLLAGHAVGGI